MAWRMVQQPDGKFARFSEVVDDFTHLGLSKRAAILACVARMCTPAEARAKVASAVRYPERWEEALRIVERVHGAKRAREVEAIGNGARR